MCRASTTSLSLHFDNMVSIGTSVSLETASITSERILWEIHIFHAILTSRREHIVSPRVIELHKQEINSHSCNPPNTGLMALRVAIDFGRVRRLGVSGVTFLYE